MPLLVQRLMEMVATLKARGVGVLLVEQRIDAALRASDHVVILEAGSVQYAGPPVELAEDSETLLRYVGVRKP
jgi:branched-chain amino acid transport system ATP-binding protein